ncbi:MAG: PQQ-dependent sugar dehydrogenase, partial [Paracoccaceae bacterium]
MRLIVITIWLLLLPSLAPAETILSSAGPLSVTQVLGGLTEPWGMTFLPGGGFLVTERGGRLIHVSQAGAVTVVRGVPNVVARGQGGLLDVVAARDFARSREIFLSYVKKQPGGSGTALAVVRLSQDARRLENLRVIFEVRPGIRSTLQFGSRIVEARDGIIYMTIGEGDQPADAQDLSVLGGSVIRIRRDGSVPRDNPFVTTAGARGEI